MKVLHIIPSVDPTHGGPIEGVRRIGHVFEEMGVTQELLTLDPPDAPYVQDYPRKVYPMGRRSGDGNDPVSRIRRWMRRSPEALAWAREHVRDYDAVVVNSLWNYSTRLARLALVGSGVPYVVYPHGMLDPWFRQRYPAKHAAKQLLWWFNEGVLLRHADAVLFTCEEERLLARTTFIPYRANERVVAYGAAAPPPADPAQVAEFRAMMPALGERRYLLFMSRIHEKKGCDLLIEAFAGAAAADPGLDLVMAGPDQTGWRATLASRASALGVAGRIHWPGMVSGPAKYGAFRGAEAFILPSHQENFGIVVAEALACRCPVLISDKVNIWREIAEAGAGLVEPDTLAGTQALLTRFMAQSESERAAIRDCAEALYQARFNMAEGARNLARILTEIANTKKELSYK